MSATSPQRVVEHMLDHAANGRWDQLPAILADEFVIVEPDSLPYGGQHRGVDGYVALLQRIGELFDLTFDLQSIRTVDAATVLLRMHVTFDARHSGRSIRMPVVEVLSLAEQRITSSEVFLADSAALLETLRDD